MTDVKKMGEYMVRDIRRNKTEMAQRLVDFVKENPDDVPGLLTLATNMTFDFISPQTALYMRGWYESLGKAPNLESFIAQCKSEMSQYSFVMSEVQEIIMKEAAWLAQEGHPAAAGER